MRFTPPKIINPKITNITDVTVIVVVFNGPIIVSIMLPSPSASTAAFPIALA